MKEYKVRITDQAKLHLKLLKSYIDFEIKYPQASNKILSLIKENIKSLSLYAL